MAYIVDSLLSELASASAATSFTVELPDGYIVDDLILACVSQDGGGATINAPAGWVQINTQAKVSANRTVWFYLKATTVSETDPTFTGADDQWAASIFVVRDQDLTSPIHDSTRTSWSGGGPVDAASLTTTADDCLILYSWGCDYSTALVTNTPDDIIDYSYIGSGANIQLLGFKQQIMQGAVPIPTMAPSRTNEGGSRHTIAIANKTGGNISYDCSKTVNIAERFGIYNSPPISLDPSLYVSSVDGVNVFSKACSFSNGDYTGVDVGGTSTTGEWLGTAVALDSTTDYTDKILSVTVQLSETTASRFGVKGICTVLIDSLGNWSAYSLGLRTFWTKDITEYINIAVSDITPYDTSGTLDFTDVTHVAFLAHKVSGNTQVQTMRLSNLLCKDLPVYISGSNASPISPSILELTLARIRMLGNAGRQGNNQGLSSSGMQLGDGVSESYVDFTASSYETPLPDSVEYQYVASTLPIVIYASAADTMHIKSCVLSTKLRNSFTIHANSSLSASYDFSGASIVNWDITWQSGITCNSANITDCNVLQNNGTFDSCIISNSEVLSTNLDNLVGNTFINSLGTGYAVELTSPITSDTAMLWDNKFSSSDYSVVDGSTGNEVLKVDVDTGFTLTVNVSATANTPTVHNIGGGSVSVVAGQKTFSFTVSPSITGYEWRLYEKNSTEGTIGGTELDGEETATQDNQSYAYTYVSDVQVALQIIASGYEEHLSYPFLLDQDQDFTINLKVENNT